MTQSTCFGCPATHKPEQRKYTTNSDNNDNDNDNDNDNNKKKMDKNSENKNNDNNKQQVAVPTNMLLSGLTLTETYKISQVSSSSKWCQRRWRQRNDVSFQNACRLASFPMMPLPPQTLITLLSTCSPPPPTKTVSLLRGLQGRSATALVR